MSRVVQRFWPVRGGLPLFVMAFLAAIDLSAQVSPPAICPETDLGRPDVVSILDHFKREAPGVGLGSTCLTTLFLDWETYPEESRLALDGLESLAIEGSQSVRRAAISKLGQAGSVREGWPGVPGVIARLARVYDASDHPIEKNVIAGHMISLPDTAAAVDFLVSLAIQDEDSQDFPGAAERGVHLLSYLGQPGRVALARIHREGLVRSPAARMQLRILEQRGYRPRRR